MNLNKIITDCHNIAKSFAPVDSGNLRENAIKITKRTKNGFTINYSYINAYYIQYVEDGTPNQKAQHFIRDTYLYIVEYLNSLAKNSRQPYGKESKYRSRTMDTRLYNHNPDYRTLVHERSYGEINKRFYEEEVR
jgi:HK97 gp10 family phage protein